MRGWVVVSCLALGAGSGCGEPDAEGGPATEVSWRLVAGVRPPREAEVPEVAVVELALRGVSE